MKKKLSRVAVCVIVAISAPFFQSVTVFADAVTDTVGIYIGYFGWEEEQYVKKIEYNWQELDDQFGGVLSTHEHVYSYYNGDRLYLAAGRGFYIKDLLEYAKIDFGSISRIDFFTKDQTIGAYRSFTKESLFDIPRYYFPNLAVNTGTGEQYPFQGGDIYDGAVRIEPMLALEDYSEWDSVGYTFEKLYSKDLFSANSRFHLLFGQIAPTEANTSSAAKYVYKLLITFSGTPKLSFDGTNIDMKVGSNFKMTVNVSAEDSLLDQYVKDNIVWSSNNEEIIAVDNFGNVTVKGEGEATVTASFGEMSATATVSGQNGASDTAARGDGEVLPQGEADSEAQNTGESLPQGETDSEAQNAGASPTEPNEAQYAENNEGVFILSDELMSKEENAQWVNSILEHEYIESEEEGALNNARKEALDDDARQLTLLGYQSKSFMVAVFLTLGAFFASGFGYGLISFKRKL